MDPLEWLALLRLVVIGIALPFAIRGRYWLLTAALVVGAGVAVLSVGGATRVIGSSLALPLYGLLALHALDISRRRRTP